MKSGQEFILKHCESTLLLYSSKVNCKNKGNQQILGRHSFKKKEKKKEKSNLKAHASRAKKSLTGKFKASLLNRTI